MDLEVTGLMLSIQTQLSDVNEVLCGSQVRFTLWHVAVLATSTVSCAELPSPHWCAGVSEVTENNSNKQVLFTAAQLQPLGP